jgi:hypothetical protein
MPGKGVTVPGGHRLQKIEPDDDAKAPGEQARQDVAPLLGWKNPGEHDEQGSTPPVPNLPGEQV